MNFKTFTEKYLIYFLLAALLYMPVFGHLGNLPIRIYDEARLATNAYEMSKNGDLIVTHYMGEPDMWNTKPPLMIWCQVLMMKIFGPNEIAVRLPSAIAALFTLLALFLVGLRYLKDKWFGLIAFLVLLTSLGYIEGHNTRTGDYDAMLVMFTTLSGLAFFAFCETSRTRYLYWFFGLLAAGVLTKSISGLLFVPALVIYAFISKQAIPMLKNRHFYYGLLIFLVVVVGYYLLREFRNPGYFAAVQKNELGGRYLNVVEDHKADFWFYYFWLQYFRYSEWFLLVPCGFIIGLFSRNSRQGRLTLFASLMAIVYFLVISNAKTKLSWYDSPLYPYLALIVSSFLTVVFHALKDYKWFNQNLKINIVPFVFLFLVFINPYHKIINKTYCPKEDGQWKEFYQLGYYLQDAVKGKVNLNGQYLILAGYNPQYLFYMNVLRDKGLKIDVKDFAKLEPGDKVISFQPDIEQYIENTYLCEKISTYENSVITYKINGRKPA